MTTIVTRAGKGSPLTNTEVDTNFTNLNSAKIETLTSTDSSVTITGTGSARDLSVPVNPNVVSGPAAATDNALVRFDGTTGKLIQNGLVTSDDAGNVANINSLGFDTTPTTVPTTEGSLYWDSADGNQTLSLVMAGGNATQQIGQEQYYRIKASSAITNGQVVMFTGTVGASGGLTGAPATGLTAATASYIMGIATQDIALNGWGYVTSFGLVRGINTTAYTDGAILYFNPAVVGGLTATIPTAPNPKVQVGACVYAASNGAIFVRPSIGGTFGMFEGDVNVSSATTGDLLSRNGSGVWTNIAQSAINAGTATNADQLDGQHGSYYQPASTAITTSNIGAQSVNYAASAGNADTLDGNHAAAFYLATNPNGYTTNTGTVTDVATGTGLTGGPITTTGTVSLANTAVTPGSYTYSSITVDQQGRITSASSGASPSAFPAGTIMLFRQTAAPTGWTKDITNYDGSAMRVVTGTVSSGGTVAFTTAFASQTPAGSVSVNTSGLSAGATTLSTAQMPSHTHSQNFGGGNVLGINTDGYGNCGGSTTGAQGGGGSHSHAMSGSATATFTGTAINLAVKYCDVIFATKG